MPRRFAHSSIAARLWRRAISGLVLASLVVLAIAPAAHAARSTNAWLAKVGSSGANGTAAINADVAYGYAAVWVTNLGDGTVQRIDPVTNLTVTAISVPGATSVTVDGNAVWVVNVLGIVSRIDPLTNLVVTTIATQPTGGYVIAGNGSIWVSNPGAKGARGRQRDPDRSDHEHGPREHLRGRSPV